MHTSDDAQQLVELHNQNGLEAWRQLAIRFEPIDESYVFDQMSALMDVPRWKQSVELQPPSRGGSEVSSSMRRRREARQFQQSGNCPFYSN